MRERVAVHLLLASVCLGLLPGNGALAQTAGAQGTATAPSRADERLRALYNAEWAWRQNELGQLEGSGPGALADHLPKVDAASQAARLAYWENVLRQLDAIPVDQLSPEEKINAAVFRASIEGLANDVRFKIYEAPFNADTFFWAGIGPRQGFDNAEEYRRYIGRLCDIPRYFDENIANMRTGLARGFSVPRVSVTGRDATIEPYLAADETSPLFRAFTHMPSNIPAAEQQQLRTEGLAAIREAAAPAYRALLDFMRNDYMRQTRTAIGASEMPDGEAYYQAMIRKFTTLEITPQEVHQTGLREVARIRAEMEQVMRRANFTGTFPEFLQFLRTDPQFYAKTPNELLGYASYVVMRAQGQLRNIIGTLPRYRHGIIPVPDELAPIYTGGRGGLQNCMFNTYNLPARPLYTLPSLALHECTPGHSFQAALALEGPNRPAFRQETYFSGYGEGWGLYTEWLGTVMGIYQTPYEDFGRLTYEMWRACRLVVDTGIHQFGWSRDRALAYLRDNTALSEHEITTEVDRYIAWPGQAVAYKLGEITIRRLRAEAEQRLGTRFDQRGFHDTILGLGSVPLPVLEEQVRAWIASVENAPATPAGRTTG
ncbi:DUF885 family protein [Sphingosinicella sp. LHD-64]|uniref:DUF885 domain-containing protein n=1 Tax=Sphingosinicella sp. LHD-64 TaxID=3072139 RepID=UPI00280CCEB6|nr:DUF885 family protein [Sphingosinicella sp. LHD-64]MDQ8755489.1 DUF885 family protein [Sphingosinicella sp. LHD-64]